MTVQERKTDYDVVVIGGGAAGLGGALMLARARHSVLLVDSGQPRNAPAAHMHGFPTRDGASPVEFIKAGRAELRGYGVELVDAVARSASATEDGIRVELDGGRVVRGRRLLAATGLHDELPELPGLAERWGKDVLHCPYCHGWEVRDQRIAVLSTGPFAVHQAMLFSQWTSDLRLLLHTGPEPTEAEAEELAARGVEVTPGEVERLVVVDDKLTGVRLRSGETIAVQAVVAGPRFAARADVLRTLGLVPTPWPGDVGDYIAADADGRTEVPNVWVAGNVTSPAALLLGAAAAGAQAAVTIIDDLLAEDTRRAVEARRAAAAPSR
ncbi:NAD(P)/FAD-dependent oxidoreductase [Saccharothrix sp. NRRL B-16314]|uniref:NAD(P)/FAD-dependent oxidoreductase n=1 Tax=Saccharothrix sp. NRRL B-16314 TaxID=1463825 RepID=UPI000526033C|nr:NAD(P)/FAD-dependent oxidoreductase [Saccharothrix sp. NRRL B-16314]